ncbi:hypothetical protein MTO96_045030 [Rhipicephalus appendiculatus]
MSTCFLYNEQRSRVPPYLTRVGTFGLSKAIMTVLVLLRRLAILMRKRFSAAVRISKISAVQRSFSWAFGFTYHRQEAGGVTQSCRLISTLAVRGTHSSLGYCEDPAPRENEQLIPVELREQTIVTFI